MTGFTHFIVLLLATSCAGNSVDVQFNNWLDLLPCILIIVIGGLVTIVVISVGYRYRWWVILYAYNLKTCLRRGRRMGYERINDDPESGENYDIFLANSPDCRMMLPVLEHITTRGFSVKTLNWRNSVFEESVTAIQQSRKTVFLVTKELAQNSVCNLQLKIAVMKGKENIILLQMDLMSELCNAGMEPVLSRLLLSHGAMEYCDNEDFWQTLENKVRN